MPMRIADGPRRESGGGGGCMTWVGAAGVPLQGSGWAGGGGGRKGGCTAEAEQVLVGTSGLGWLIMFFGGVHL